jgi:hypothetical protein
VDQGEPRPLFLTADKIPLAIVSLVALALAVGRVFIQSTRAGMTTPSPRFWSSQFLPWIPAVVKKLQVGGVTFEAQ